MNYTWTSGDITSSRIIYGCMRIGGTWDTTPPDAETRRRAFAALDAALEAGITAFDHADIYCRGKSESLFGEWLRANPGVRERITIQTKCGIILPDPAPTTMYDHSRDHILASVHAALARLGIETIDVLLLHRPDPLAVPEEVARVWDEISTAGLVRRLGVSNHSATQIELLRRTCGCPVVVNQMEVSLAHPDLLLAGTAVNQREPNHHHRAGDTVEDALLNGTQLQAWSPLSHGRYTPAAAPGGDRPDASSADAAVAATSHLVAELAAHYGVSREAIVLAWIMRHPARIMPVIGTVSPDRIRACVEAESIELTREEWYRLAAAARGHAMP